MPLNEEKIKECEMRYSRERDRFQKMADIVYQKCCEIVYEKLTIRATVQRRVKTESSFVGKIRKKQDFTTAEEVFTGIKDLAGVRIATYLESDREKVVNEIKNFFGGGEGTEIVVKEKDEKDKHYRATHCQVFLLEEDLAGNNKNLKDTTCEIQVCSLLAHVFNEIEHDLQYKPNSGALSDSEKDLIDQLALLTKAGDTTIKLLLAARDQRLSEKTGEFEDVFDFVARMRNEFKGSAVFSGNAGQLYDELQSLNLKSLKQIREAICVDGEELANICQREYERLKEYDDKNCKNLLEDDSSDLLLVGLLSKKWEVILDRHPTGRGKGRPSRLVQIAKMYKDMSEEK